MTTRYIEFDGFQGQAGSNQRLRIGVINRGRSAFEVKLADDKFVLVVPNVRFNLYDGEITTSTNSLRLPVSGIEHRTTCEFRLEVSGPSEFRGAIRIYVIRESASM